MAPAANGTSVGPDEPPMMVSGWFQIGWSWDLAHGQVVPIHYFGSDLVMWRTGDGSLCVADAYCPHLGAHLGYGGSVRGDFLRCPLHLMEWRRDGTSVGESCDGALRMWPAREATGIMYLWHDEAARDPWFEPADAFEPFDDGLVEQNFTLNPPGGVTVHRSVRVHPQTAMEDRVDYVHFAGTHMAHNPHFAPAQFENDRFRSDFVISFDPDSGEPESGLESVNLGLGVSYLRLWGRGNHRYVLAVTPIDDAVSDVFLTIWISRSCEGGDRQEYGPDAVAESTKRELLNDLRIWANKRFTPLGTRIAPHEADLVELRSWARRFYPPSWTQGPKIPGSPDPGVGG